MPFGKGGVPNKQRRWNRAALRAEIESLVAPELRNGDECWEWYRDYGPGYPMIRVAGRKVLLHRIVAWVWRIAPKPIPPLDRKRDVVMHSCDNRRCFNPRHLSHGTQTQNIQDAIRKGRRLSKCSKTHCKHGHPFAGDNVYLFNGYQRCRTCHADVERARRRRMGIRPRYPLAA